MKCWDMKHILALPTSVEICSNKGYQRVGWDQGLSAPQQPGQRESWAARIRVCQFEGCTQTPAPQQPGQRVSWAARIRVCQFEGCTQTPAPQQPGRRVSWAAGIRVCQFEGCTQTPAPQQPGCRDQDLQ